MMTTNQRPAKTIRDGKLSASIWRNQSQSGPFYSVTFERVYTNDEGQTKNAASFSGSEILRIGRLASLAYGEIAELRAAEKQAAQAAA